MPPGDQRHSDRKSRRNHVAQQKVSRRDAENRVRNVKAESSPAR